MDLDFARPYFGNEEREAVRKVLEGHWLASGKENEAFEEEFAHLIGVPYALCVNSGSSANLVALAALNLPRGAKVLTSGCGFPATLNPILHMGLEPVLVDYDRKTFNIDVDQVVQKLPYVDALILAHTMGNPVDMKTIMHWAEHFGVAVIEDCCEALGAKLDGKQVGSFGDVGTFSFYPSHQITALGGGGMVTFKSLKDFHRAKSMRDWGKSATWDMYGRNNTAYSVVVDGVPYFPHYVYSTVGWNFKLPEANAAFGREQLKRLDWIVSERKKNHDRIMWFLSEEVAGMCSAQVVEGAEPSWFGVLLTHPERNRIGYELEERGVRHRPFFAGNITRHDPYKHLHAHLPVADFLMENTLFVGCYAGLTEDQCQYIAEAIEESVNVVRGEQRLHLVASQR